MASLPSTFYIPFVRRSFSEGGLFICSTVPFLLINLSTFQLFNYLSSIPTLSLQPPHQLPIIPLTHRYLFASNSYLVSFHLFNLVYSHHERPMYSHKLVFRQLIDHFQEGAAGKYRRIVLYKKADIVASSFQLQDVFKQYLHLFITGF